MHGGKKRKKQMINWISFIYLTFIYPGKVIEDSLSFAKLIWALDKNLTQSKVKANASYIYNKKYNVPQIRNTLHHST